MPNLIPLETKQAFLERLASGLSAPQAADAVGLNVMTAYAWRRNDPEIAEIWADVTSVRRDSIRVVLERKILGALRDFGEEFLRDPATGEPVLDDNFERIPLARVVNDKHLGELAMKFYAALTEGDRRPNTAVQVNVGGEAAAYQPAVAVRILNADGSEYRPAGAVDAEFEEAEDEEG